MKKITIITILLALVAMTGRERKRALEKALWLLLLYVFFLHLGLPYANWA